MPQTASEAVGSDADTLVRSTVETVSQKLELSSGKLYERVNRALSYRERFPGTSLKDAGRNVLNNDFRGNMTEGQKQQRNSYSRAMGQVFKAIEPGEA